MVSMIHMLDVITVLVVLTAIITIAAHIEHGRVQRRALRRHSGLRIVMLSGMAIEPKGTLRARAVPLAKALGQRGHSVKIISAPLDNLLLSGVRKLFDGVSVHHIRLVPPYQLSAIAALAFYTIRETPDIVYLFKPVGAPGAAALVLQRLFGQIVVLDVDDIEGSGGWARLDRHSMLVRKAADLQEWYWFKFAPAITAATRQCMAYMRTFGRGRRAVYLLPNCPRLPRLGKVPSDVFTVTFLGYVPLTNDLDQLVEAATLLMSQGERVRFVIGGTGPGLSAIRDKILHLSPHPDFLFPGFLSDSDASAILSRSDVGIFPASMSAVNNAKCPAKVVEYMNAGLATVAASVRGTREYIIHGETGLLTSPGSAEELAAAILQLYRNADLRVKLGANAQAFVEEANLSWNRVAREAESAFLSALGVDDTSLWERRPPLHLADDK